MGRLQGQPPAVPISLPQQLAQALRRCLNVPALWVALCQVHSFPARTITTGSPCSARTCSRQRVLLACWRAGRVHHEIYTDDHSPLTLNTSISRCQDCLYRPFAGGGRMTGRATSAGGGAATLVVGAGAEGPERHRIRRRVAILPLSCDRCNCIILWLASVKRPPAQVNFQGRSLAAGGLQFTTV